MKSKGAKTLCRATDEPRSIPAQLQSDLDSQKNSSMGYIYIYIYSVKQKQVLTLIKGRGYDTAGTGSEEKQEGKKFERF